MHGSKTFVQKSVILLVDDQTTDIRVLSETVRDLGSVHLALNGETALIIARQCRPDVVLLDIEMPHMDGFEVCKALKADPRLCDASVIFVTSHGQVDNQLYSLEIGGIGFIQKPINAVVARAYVSAHVELRRAAKKLAYHDALTDLPNRILLQDRAEQALQIAQKNHSKVGMLLLDLDNFKGINDSIGHSVGDAILKQVAERLFESSQAMDTVSRQGGDEFILLLPNIRGFEALGDLAAGVLTSLANPFCIEEQRYSLTASIGISIFPDDSDDLESLYRHADAAMYQAKLEGRNRYRFFSPAIEHNMQARYLLEQHMRRALDESLLEVFYQPKVDVQTMRVVGIEALIRWQNNLGQLISPVDFIPLAEETGLIVPVGKYVLLKACQDAQRLYEKGMGISVSVNISAVQFREQSFLPMIQEALLSTGLPSELLELEITEGVLARDLDNADAVLQAIKSMGVRVAIDDFGTGYSSLAYLKRFPLDVLKIDQSFVRDMLTDKSDAAIIEAIIKLAQALDFELVAEGVETQAQADALNAIGCTVMQGYLYSRPIPFVQLCEFLCGGLGSSAKPTL